MPSRNPPSQPTVTISMCSSGAKFSKVSAELLIGGLRRIQAQQMHPLGRGQLKAREDMNPTVARCGSKGRDTVDAIVVRDSKHLDAQFLGLVNDVLCVAISVSLGSLPPIGLRIVMRIHLKRTPIEPRTTRMLRSGDYSALQC